MSWVYLDDKFHSNAKTLEVGNDGAGLYVRALSYCGDHLTDGYVPQGWAREAGRPATRKKVTESGLWIEVAGGEEFHYQHGEEFYVVKVEKPGYFIPDYLLLNPDRASVMQKRSELSQKRADAGRKGAMKRWQRDGNGDGKTMASGMASAWQPDSPLPQPRRENPDGFSHIVDFWLDWSPPLIKHRESIRDSRVAAKAGAKALKAYPVDDVCGAIRNYASVLSSSTHYFNHKWTLPDFLTRGLHRFVDEAEPLTNFAAKDATQSRDRGMSFAEILNGGNEDGPRAIPFRSVA